MLLLADDNNDSSSRRMDAVVEAVASAHISTITAPLTNTTILRNGNLNVNNTIDNRNTNVVTPSESSTTSEMTLASTSPPIIGTKNRIHSLVNRGRRRNVCKNLPLHRRNDISNKLIENEIDNVEDEEEDEYIDQHQNTEDESHDEMEEMEHDDDEDDEDEDENENNENKRCQTLRRQSNVNISTNNRRRQMRRYSDEDVIICSKCRRHFTIAQFSFFLEHKVARCQDNKIEINSEHSIITSRQHTPSDSSLLAASSADSPPPVNSVAEYGLSVNDISTMTTSSALYTFTSNLNSRKRHSDNITESTIQQREIGVDTSDINNGNF